MRTSILFRRRYDEHVFLIIAQEKIAILNKIFLRVESFFIYFTILCSKELSLGDYFKGNKRSFYFLIFIARRYIFYLLLISLVSCLTVRAMENS